MKVMLSLLLTSSAVFAMHEQLSLIDSTKKLLIERFQYVVLSGSLQDFEDHSKLLQACDGDIIKALQAVSQDYALALQRVREVESGKYFSTPPTVTICGHVISIKHAVGSLSNKKTREHIELEQSRVAYINKALSIMIINKLAE